jgi:hypothetical protein
VKLETRSLKLEWIWILFLLPFLIFPMVGSAVTGPKLVCDAPIYNFGTVGQSAVITNVFVIRNEGDTTFAAGMPRATCSCTAVRLDKRLIGPGESASLTAVFTAARRRGEQKKAIYLPEAGALEPTVKLYMQGFVETPAVSQ